MKKRFFRGVSIAVASGLVLAGGAALGAGTSATAIKFKSGKEFPSVATRFDGATVGSKVYFLGFRVDDAGTTDGSIWYYDIKNDKYVDTKVDMPVPISNYSVAILKDSKGTGLYTFGGRDANGETLKTVQVYYPSTNRASIVKSDPWPGKTPSKCISLPATGVAVVSNMAYVMGGMSFATSVPPCTDDQSKQVWRFNPTADAGKKWKAMPSLNKPRGYISPAVIGSTIYAVGGDINDAGTLAAQPTVEAWKVGANSWNDKGIANLPQGCDESQAFGFGSGPLANTVTLAGCGQWPGALPDVLQYDVKRDKWSTVGALQEARRNHAGANIGTDKNPKLMVVGGYNLDGSAILSTSEIGKPAAFKGGVLPTHQHLSLTGGGASTF